MSNKQPEFVTLGEIAQRTKYSKKYLANRWPRLLGLKPQGFGRKLLFDWNDVVEKIKARGNS